MNPEFASIGQYMCTFRDHVLFVCGFDANAAWTYGADISSILLQNEQPISMTGFGDGGPQVVVLTSTNRFLRCGLIPPRVWEVFNIPQPTGAMFQELIGAGLWTHDNATWFLAARGLNAAGSNVTFVVGNPLGGGAWVELPVH